jgi:hypothetical protein
VRYVAEYGHFVLGKGHLKIPMVHTMSKFSQISQRFL